MNLTREALEAFSILNALPARERQAIMEWLREVRAALPATPARRELLN
jgi:hypothetical protein